MGVKSGLGVRLGVWVGVRVGVRLGFGFRVGEIEVSGRG